MRHQRKYKELAEEINQVQLRDLRAKAATDLSLMIDDERARKQLWSCTSASKNPLNITSEKKTTQSYQIKRPLQEGLFLS